jgi:hypothetical protein
MADRSRARLFFDEITGNKEGAYLFLTSLLNGGEAAAENGWRDYKEAAFLGQPGNADGTKRQGVDIVVAGCVSRISHRW